MRAKSKLIAGVLTYLFGGLCFIIVHHTYENEKAASNQRPAAFQNVNNDIILRNGSVQVVSNDNARKYRIVDPHKPLQGGLKLPMPGYQFGALSNKSKIPLIIGIPTVKREGVDYLVETIESLISNNEADGISIKIVIFVGETNRTYVREKSKALYQRFKYQFDDGNLQIISAPENYYPDWKATLAHNLNDPLDRVFWRSKQNLDQVFLMMYIYNLSPLYYLMMEDDIAASNGYLKKILTEAIKREREDWFYLSFCRLGAIGKLFRTSYIASCSSFLYTFWNKKPLDWLLVDYASTTYCSYDESNKRCKERLSSKMPDISPSLFQHVGRFSSLKGKIQNAKDSTFKRKH